MTTDKVDDGIWCFSDLILSATLSEVIVKGRSQKILERPDILKKILTAIHEQEDSTYVGEIGNESVYTGGQKHFSMCVMDQLFRVSVSHPAPSTQSSAKFYYLRHIAKTILPLRVQGYEDGLIRRLMKKDRQGLIIFSGPMGMGKTSGASAMVHEWLELNGGTAITLEDPPEYPLWGWHGKGFCIPHATNAAQITEMIADSKRWGAPELLYIGELREPVPTRQAILESVNGSLVVCTLHSRSVPDSIWRLQSISAEADGDGLSRLLAEGLSLVIHQHLEKSPAGHVLLHTSTLDCEDPDTQVAIREHIRKNQPYQLSGFTNNIRNRSLVDSSL